MSGGMKIVKARMRTVTNIGKITKAMKMVATSKLRRDRERLEEGMPFAMSACNFMTHLPEDKRSVPVMYVACGGDKGLCGGVNSSVVKNIRNTINASESGGGGAQIFTVGNKTATGLKRMFGDRFVRQCDAHTGTHTNFSNASAIATRIVATDPEKIVFVYNHLKSLIAYPTVMENGVTMKGMESIDKLELSKAIDQYSFEPDRVESFEDLHEFYLASALYRNMLDGMASEQASRMAAMENASKNAGEMLNKLTLKYNRARQAKITTELCEIISGASAL